MRCDLPFVQAYRDRHGKPRHYFRKRGSARVALPGEPGTPEFLTAYQAAFAGPAPAVTIKSASGSFDALCREYLGSAEFSSLATSTRAEMRRVIERLAAMHGPKPVVLLERQHILRWRDGMLERPGAANTMLRTLGVLLSFAIDRGYRKDNPARAIKLLKATPFRAWTDDELEQFETAWPLGTLERTGFALALYTAQRRADLVRMSWRDVAGDVILVTQGKTGARLEVPIHPHLAVALASVRPRYESAILTGAAQTALSPVYFGHLMAAAIEKAGLPPGCVLHGLRKSATCALIDAGCTPHQAAAITGHKSMRMLEHYARDRSQHKLGKAAMVMWGGAKR